MLSPPILYSYLNAFSSSMNVLSGGTLMHHIENHNISHTMTCGSDEKPFKVTSSHHQMCVPSPEGIVLGWSTESRSSIYLGDEDKQEDYQGKEVEAICYPKNSIFAVQYHPEWMSEESEAYLWYHEAVQDLLSMRIDEFVRKYNPNQKTVAV